MLLRFPPAPSPCSLFPFFFSYSSILTHCSRFSLVAKCSGVSPCLFAAFRFAPFSNSSSNTSGLSPRTASCTRVFPVMAWAAFRCKPKREPSNSKYLRAKRA